ncbi:hypothetical protein COCNU_05G006490 [Cocos nucifera]|uniref:Uncharacterized protein n=1 Tax=Cocos nucifera TaxID=13894 RepID=A0A8K0I8K7_COCNU|nr:hypothetical protein COCNU_05G006490 [Cocos nucifera]
MASMMGGDFAQVYVMRKLHKEKMKRMEEEMGGKKSKEKKPNNGLFFGLRKKVHPNGLSSLENACNAGDAAVVH